MFFIESEKKNNSNGILCDESLMLMTVDVEDWFQVENLKKSISFSAWPSFKLRVEENTFRLLDLLDSYKQSYKMENGRTERVYAPTTFLFLDGWPNGFPTWCVKYTGGDMKLPLMAICTICVNNNPLIT